MSITSGIYWDHPGVTGSYLDGPYIFDTRTCVFFRGGKLCKPEKIGVFLRNSMPHRHGMKRIVKEPPHKDNGIFQRISRNQLLKKRVFVPLMCFHSAY